MQEYLKNWIITIYRICIEESLKKSTEGEFATILMDSNRLKLLSKLEAGPIELEKLEMWLNITLGKNINFQELLAPLINSNLAVTTKNEGITYVILLKGLRVYRITPTNTLEKLRSFGSIYPELYPNLLRQYNRELRIFFRKYKVTHQEMVTLSQIIFDPLNYHIISRLRKAGIYLKDDLEEEFETPISKFLRNKIDYLKEKHIIAEIKANKEVFILLKTDIRFVKTIPKYVLLMKKGKFSLPDPLDKLINKVSEAPEPIKAIFKRWFA
jgi:hypothetical protein